MQIVWGHSMVTQILLYKFVTPIIGFTMVQDVTGMMVCFNWNMMYVDV